MLKFKFCHYYPTANPVVHKVKSAIVGQSYFDFIKSAVMTQQKLISALFAVI
jgi:hypothetical protein